MRLEALIGDILNTVTFVLSESLGEDRSVGDDGVMDLWKRNEISLKLREVDIQGPIKAKGRSDGRHNYIVNNLSKKRVTLYDKSIQILIDRSRNTQISFTNVENGFIINQELQAINKEEEN